MPKIVLYFIIGTILLLGFFPGAVFALPAPGTDTGQVNPCKFAGAQQKACETCMKSGTAAWTAIGCIDASPSKFVGSLLGLAIGMAGGIAFLLILFGGFQIITSAGNPEKLNAGRELIASAVAGLLFIIFSLFLLRLIGYTIFQIPGFG